MILLAAKCHDEELSAGRQYDGEIFAAWCHVEEILEERCLRTKNPDQVVYEIGAMRRFHRVNLGKEHA